MERPGYVFGFLRRRLDDATVDQVSRMRLTKDQRGAVFDVPAALTDDFVARSVSTCRHASCATPELLRQTGIALQQRVAQVWPPVFSGHFFGWPDQLLGHSRAHDGA
jgi:hypothetical protein